MVRKYVSKRRSSKKKSTVYRKRRRFNVTGKRMRFMRFTRWSSLNATYNTHLVITGSNVSYSSQGSTQFRLSDTSGYTELRNLFDNYCIRKVLYRWVVSRDPSAVTGNTSTVGTFPRLCWVHDFNDSTPINRLQMQQHPRMREVFFTENYQRTKWYTLKPASLTQFFEGTVATASKPTWGAFVDTNDYDMPHYGIKYQYDELYQGVNLYLEAKVVIDCKGIS